MERNFTENIADRNEFSQNVQYFLRQASGRKTSTYSLDRTKNSFGRYLDDNIMNEDVTFLNFSKPKYNYVLNKTFHQFNNDNPDIKKDLQGRIGTMVDDYVAKDIRQDQNTIGSLGQLVGEIVQRRGGLHNTLFGLFFTRILNDKIRQIVWRAALVIY